MVHIRWLIRSDMPEILAIEQASFESAWDEDEFISTLRQRNVIGHVAEEGESIVGYTIYEVHKKWLNILNLAVDPQRRRQGVGNLIGKLSPQRRTWIDTLVIESNVGAQQFFKATGFRCVKQIADTYEDRPGELAYLFRYRLTWPQSRWDAVNRIARPAQVLISERFQDGGHGAEQS